MHSFPSHLNKLIAQFKKLPGIGQKSAERFAFHLLDWPKEQLEEMASCLFKAPEEILFCTSCGCVKGRGECAFCIPEREASGLLCVIAHFKDAFALEQTREFRGLYHALGGLLSPLEDIGPEQLRLKELRERASGAKIREIVLALDSTLEGDATALYIKQEFQGLPLHISRLAFGLPMGSALDYVDGGTLARAFSGRRDF